MHKKIFPRLVKKFDISNLVFKEFADLESRYILFSIVKKPKSIQEISEDEKIPLSTVYKKIQNLSEISLVSEKREFLDNGRIIKLYQSRVTDVAINISKFEPTISFNKNPKIKK